MFRKCFASKNRYKVGVTIFGFILSLVVVVSFSAEKTLSQDIKPSPPEQYEIASDPTLSEKVMKMEQRLEKEFEVYFNRNLADVAQAGDDIAQTLLEISQKSNIKPAVFWAIPESEYLHLVFISPGKQPLVQDIESLKRKTLIDTVKAFHYEITNPRQLYTDSYLSHAKQLYQWIIKPFEANLKKEGIDTVLFCLGKGLRTLPIAALHDGEKFLIEKYSLSIIPAFNLIDSNYTPIQKARILAMGASEFPNNSPLPAVPIELTTIVDADAMEKISTQAISNRWPGKLFLNQDFTLNNLKTQVASRAFNIIHLATHAEFKPGKPENSYIQFWDTKLNLDQMKEIRWNNPPAELLVLSACETAVGDEDVELGFAGLALQAGVQSALASLWYVSDIGTLALMSEFYQQLKTAPTKAETIRQTQIKMIQGKVRLTKDALKFSGGEKPLPESLSTLGETDFSHPFYWSGFTLISSPW
ncbi:MAG: CHAT domain-containing protein [Lyngbya sp.]|nr:CHAT domain-containing protein [Lyngbya sp.]